MADLQQNLKAAERVFSISCTRLSSPDASEEEIGSLLAAALASSSFLLKVGESLCKPACSPVVADAPDVVAPCSVGIKKLRSYYVTEGIAECTSGVDKGVFESFGPDEEVVARLDSVSSAQRPLGESGGGLDEQALGSDLRTRGVALFGEGILGSELFSSETSADAVLVWLKCCEKSGRVAFGGRRSVHVANRLSLVAPGQCASWLECMKNLVIALQLAHNLVKDLTLVGEEGLITDEGASLGKFTVYLGSMLPELAGSGGFTATRWRARLAAIELAVLLFQIELSSSTSCRGSAVSEEHLTRMQAELLDWLVLRMALRDPQWQVRLGAIKSLGKVLKQFSTLIAIESCRHYWGLLATALDKQPEVQNAAIHLILDDLLIPMGQHCQVVIAGLINQFVRTASLSKRTLQKLSGNTVVTGNIHFDSCPDGPLLLSAVTAALRLQLLPCSVSLEITSLEQNLNKVPLLVAAASIVLEETENTGNGLIYTEILEMLRSFSMSGYGVPVVMMISSKDPVYTGASIARKYRASSIITDEIADLFEGVDTMTILKGVAIATEGLGTQENLRSLCQPEVLAEEWDLGKYEVNALRHIAEMLKIPSDFTKGPREAGIDSKVEEFLACSKSFLRIACAIVKERSWLHEVDPETKMMLDELVLSCAALAAANGDSGASLAWTTKEVQGLARDVVYSMSEALHQRDTYQIQDGVVIGNQPKDAKFARSCEMLMLEMLPVVLPLLKNRVKGDADMTNVESFNESSLKFYEDSPTTAAHQMFWCLKQVTHPHLGSICPTVMPCVLTMLDHYSPDVKRQAMKTFIHLANNLNPSELRWYKDIVLDAVTRNIVGCRDLWPIVVEMAVILVTSIEGRNPRGIWYRRILDEMLGELERQHGDSKHCLVWLQHIGKQFEYMGLVLVAHFKRLLPLLFSWLKTMDDSVCLLVLENMCIIIKCTWPRIPFHAVRFWNELVSAYCKSLDRTSGPNIRVAITEVCVLLKLCSGPSFEMAWQNGQSNSILEPLISALAGIPEPTSNQNEL